MSKGTSCAKALNKWQERNDNQDPSEAKIIKLCCMIPLIEVMDGNTLSTLNKCEHLSLSSNGIDKMKPMPALRNLKILSLSRNKIKRIGGLDEIGDTLEELWLSYNVIDTLNGLHPCRKLKILYLSNNKITKWDEIDKLRDLPKIDKVVFTGNPIYSKD